MMALRLLASVRSEMQKDEETRARKSKDRGGMPLFLFKKKEDGFQSKWTVED